MDFSREEYWSGLPFPSPGDLPDPGIKPRSPALRVDPLPTEPPGKPEATCFNLVANKNIQRQEATLENNACAHYLDYSDDPWMYIHTHVCCLLFYANRASLGLLLKVTQEKINFKKKKNSFTCPLSFCTFDGICYTSVKYYLHKKIKLSSSKYSCCLL